MDPLSMTASIIAVVQSTTSVTKYISSVKNASSEQVKVAVEASNLFGLLTSLRFRVESAQSSDPWFQQVRMLGIKGGPLDQIKETPESMVKRTTNPSLRKIDQFLSALKWEFTKSEVKEALQRMERLKSSLSQAIKVDISALIEKTAHINIQTKLLRSHADQQSQDRLSSWLGIPDPSTNYHAALERRHPKTGSWLLNSETFVEWRGSGGPFVWLHGNAGCGKTILSSAVLQDIQSRDSESQIVVAYFYFDFNDAGKQSPKKAIRSLLFQLAVQTQHCLETLEQLYQRCEKGIRQPAEETVWYLLQDAVSRTKHVYIVLDAIDECKDREPLLIYLRVLIEENLQGLHVIATSRREKDIEEVFSSLADHNLNIESAVVDRDIEVYVRDRLATDKKLRKWRPAVQAIFERKIAEKWKSKNHIKAAKATIPD